MPCVYILKGDRYYVGSTTNLNRRFFEHKRGHTHTTKRIGNWELVKVIKTETIEEARLLERKIKKSGHVDRWIKE
jgi:predicted GIY-YIG superfamily endonuclease